MTTRTTIIIAAAIAALALAGCGSTLAAAPAPAVTKTVTPAAPSTSVAAKAPAKTSEPPAASSTPAPAPSTAAPSTASGPTIIINNNPPPPSSTVYVPLTTDVPAYVTDNQGVVEQYYADLNNHDYQDAWNLGGSNIAAQNGQSYDSWVAGYSTTSWINLGTWEYYPGANVIEVTITATQTDGSVNDYQGSYTVLNGVLVGADIVQTG